MKAKGNDYLLFMYSINSLENLFNNSLERIEKMLNNIYNDKYKVIAVNNDEWNNIKKDFNQSLKDNKKIYHFIDESTLNVKNNEIVTDTKIFKTPIDNMFEDIVQYK